MSIANGWSVKILGKDHRWSDPGVVVATVAVDVSAAVAMAVVGHEKSAAEQAAIVQAAEQYFGDAAIVDSPCGLGSAPVQFGEKFFHVEIEGWSGKVLTN